MLTHLRTSREAYVINFSSGKPMPYASISMDQINNTGRDTSLMIKLDGCLRGIGSVFAWLNDYRIALDQCRSSAPESANGKRKIPRANDSNNSYRLTQHIAVFFRYLVRNGISF